MLNRVQLLQALSGITNNLQQDYAQAYEIARDAWSSICSDELFLHMVRSRDTCWSIPSWRGQLDQCVPVTPLKNFYKIISVDGSQVYPDRHQGTSCHLINIGSVVIHYGAQNPVMLSCKPFVYTGLDSAEYEDANVHEVINCKRQELELQVGLELSQRFADGQQDTVLLFDGSLVFWNLEAKNTVLSTLFFERYIGILFQLYVQRTLYAGYISVPRSRELCNIIRLSLCDFNTDAKELYTVIDPVVDATIASFFLEPHMRTNVFGNSAAISAEYPEAVRPHFFYLHVGAEIGRVEIPAWIAQDTMLVDLVASIVLDQCIKGSGYPVVLAEAHEQAVVKGPDREFFYYALQKEIVKHAPGFNHSPKEQRKRRMGV